jgi:hypothetical protein
MAVPQTTWGTLEILYLGKRKDVQKIPEGSGAEYIYRKQRAGFFKF